AVITNAGGPAILAVDALEKQGLQLAVLSEETKKELRLIVHPEGSIENPVDLLPGGTAETYKTVNEIILRDKNVDAVISIFVEPVMVQPFSVVEAVSGIVSEKPVFQVDMPLPEFWDYYRKTPGSRKPIFKNPEDPAVVISNMLFYRQRKNRILKSLNTRLKDTGLGEGGKQLKKYDFAPAGFLSQQYIARLADDYRIPQVKSTFITPEELCGFKQPEFPVVLKAISREVIHKSEFNAVRLNIKTCEELLCEASQMQSEFREHGFSIEQFLIQPYIKIKHEVLLGGFRDPSFGPVLMFGTGGKYVEIYNDTVIKSAYLSDADINEMINKTKIGKILKGVRGETPADISKLREIIKNAARMLIENEQICEFDINPLVISQNDTIYAVDIRVKISE
ncbi:MAG: acetate--CoA ligase family protein, partial [Bacillota bacterium]